MPPKLYSCIRISRFAHLYSDNLQATWLSVQRRRQWWGVHGHGYLLRRLEQDIVDDARFGI
jgi:hypothetical protein